MIRYIIKRCLQMIPTVGGVILITFVLFNLVGGSPAAMTLGQHVSPQALEEFDEQRGFNKPLLCGWWTKTRAMANLNFDSGPSPWGTVPGAVYVRASGRDPGRLVLATNALYSVPLACPLLSETRYELALVYRLAAGGEAEFRIRNTPRGEGKGLIERRGIPIPCVPQWTALRLPVSAGSGSPSLMFTVKGQPLEIRSMSLRRGMAHPLDSQLVFYLRQLARLDFGVSSSMNQPVSRVLLQGIWPSLALTLPILLVELIVSIGLALVCAFYRNAFIDRFLVVLAVALMSVNYLVWIVAGQYLLAYRLHWFPLWGFESWRFLVLPVAIGVVSGLGANLRFYRTIMLDEMYRDYVRTAFAKGVSRGGVLFRHVLKNAMIPIITNVAIALPFLYTGSLLLESFFGIPGLGYLSVNALNSADIDVVRAVVLVGSILFVAANLVADICYALVDPRVKLE